MTGGHQGGGKIDVIVRLHEAKQVIKDIKLLFKALLMSKSTATRPTTI